MNTKMGDNGETYLQETKVRKDHPKLQVIGDLDEVNAHIALIKAEFDRLLNDDETSISLIGRINSNKKHLQQIQKCLFNIKICITNTERMAEFPEETTTYLESKIQILSEKIPDLQLIVYPGGSEISCRCYVTRTVVRRLERNLSSQSFTMSLLPNKLSPQILSFTNRLSDYFLVLARHHNQIENIQETFWETPN